MKVTTGNELNSTKLAQYLKKKGHDTVVAGVEVEFLTGGTPAQELQTELSTLTQNQLDAKDEIAVPLVVDTLYTKQLQRLVLQSILDNETLTQNEENEVNARLAAL